MSRDEALTDRAFCERFGTGQRWWRRGADLRWYATADHKPPYVGPRDDPPAEVLNQEALYWRHLALAAAPLPEPVPLFGQPEALLQFLVQAGAGLIDGNFSDWPQFRPACRWAAEQLRGRETVSEPASGSTPDPIEALMALYADYCAALSPARRLDSVVATVEAVLAKRSEKQHRREGHSALRVRDGELEVFDPHPPAADVKEAAAAWQRGLQVQPVLPPNAYEGFLAGAAWAARSAIGNRSRFDDSNRYEWVCERLAEHSMYLNRYPKANETRGGWALYTNSTRLGYGETIDDAINDAMKKASDRRNTDA